MRRGTFGSMLCLALALVAGATPAAAQSSGLTIGGYGIVGRFTFAAVESFDAITGSHQPTFVGGGGTVGLPWGGLFIDVGAWRVKADGERAFVSGGDVYSLGIPVAITVTPFEVTGGWQFRNLSRRFMPYVGAGYSSFAYTERSDFATASEDVAERFAGYHVLGGAEFRLMRWLGVGGEFAWTRIPNGLGDGGVSAAFDETDLGGTSLRLKITVGQ